MSRFVSEPRKLFIEASLKLRVERGGGNICRPCMAAAPPPNTDAEQ